MDCLSRVMRLMVVVTSTMRSRLCLQMTGNYISLPERIFDGDDSTTPHGFLTL